MPFVAASDSGSEDKHRAAHVCDGIDDNIEIQGAIDMLRGGGLRMLREKLGNERWFPEVLQYWASQFPLLEERLEAGSRWVSLDKDNRATYSTELARLLRDAGSVFDSVLRALVKGTGMARGRRDHDIKDYCDFLRREVPDIERRSVTIRALVPGGVVVPFRELAAAESSPGWWTAYNKVKHEGYAEYRQGNLENAAMAVCALALVGSWMGAFSSSPLFCNVGIAYREGSIDLTDERVLFPSVRD